MCVVSMIGDHYHDKWNDLKKFFPQQQPLPLSPAPKSNPMEIFQRNVTRLEFDQLKRDVEEMKKLLQRAKIYDEKNNEPNCEIESKIETLKKVAALVGISLDDILISKANG